MVNITKNAVALLTGGCCEVAGVRSLLFLETVLGRVPLRAPRRCCIPRSVARASGLAPAALGPRAASPCSLGRRPLRWAPPCARARRVAARLGLVVVGRLGTVVLVGVGFR